MRPFRSLSLSLSLFYYSLLNAASSSHEIGQEEEFSKSGAPSVVVVYAPGMGDEKKNLTVVKRITTFVEKWKKGREEELAPFCFPPLVGVTLAGAKEAEAPSFRLLLCPGHFA